MLPERFIRKTYGPELADYLADLERRVRYLESFHIKMGPNPEHQRGEDEFDRKMMESITNAFRKHKENQGGEGKG